MFLFAGFFLLIFIGEITMYLINEIVRIERYLNERRNMIQQTQVDHILQSLAVAKYVDDLSNMISRKQVDHPY